VDWLAAERVNRLDALVHQYAVEHNGLYPTYDELVTMAEQRDKKYMTPQVDMAARGFSFRPGQADAQKVGYAVSADRRDYVLLGVGGRRREIRLYGKVIQPLSTKVHIIHPGDNPPRHLSHVTNLQKISNGMRHNCWAAKLTSCQIRPVESKKDVLKKKRSLGMYHHRDNRLYDGCRSLDVSVSLRFSNQKQAQLCRLRFPRRSVAVAVRAGI
jgi:hypothetical protein